MEVWPGGEAAIRLPLLFPVSRVKRLCLIIRMCDSYPVRKRVVSAGNYPHRESM